ncbi:MAG TPA: hypothetical protein RMI62_10170, partial [Polyangiaceae bacterium LLY-WYZ-15_(1-7)]|nr:hypothetical protein [Polyangiaceae bacterium LLY-WYZ-15_(1-7)]
MRASLALSLLFLFACGGAPAESTSDPGSSEPAGGGATPTTADPEGGAAASSEVADRRPGESGSAAAARTEPAVALEDGDAALLVDGTLRWGAASTRIEMPDANAFAWAQAALERVEVAPGETLLLLAVPTPDEEDPPNRYRLFRRADDALEPVFDHILGAYGVTPLGVPGDGSLRWVEDGWTACGRAGHPATPVARDEVIWRAGPDGVFVEASRAPTGQTQDCAMLAACPFVYRLDAGGPTLLGEILRNVRGEAETQRLPVPLAPGARTLRLRLAEEKAEVTFLDAVWLEVDGAPIAPVDCAGAHCALDGEVVVLREGDALELRFALPPGARAAALVAHGRYRPTPT